MGDRWAVGQKVSIVAFRGSVLRTPMIAKIVRNKIVLDDGTEWCGRSGKPWRSRDSLWFTGDGMRSHRPEDDDEAERCLLVRRIVAHRGDTLAALPIEMLREVARLLGEARHG